MSAGLTSLLVGLQPLATAALAGIWLGEQVSRRQWLGLALGLAGVALVVLGRIHGGADGLAWAAVLVALAAITCGTLYQKRFCGGMDLRTGGVVQYLASGACSASPRCFRKPRGAVEHAVRADPRLAGAGTLVRRRRPALR